VSKWSLIRRIARRSSLLRRLVHHPARWQVRRFLISASVLHPRARFVVGALRGGVRSYRLDRERAVIVRHGTRDLALVNEIFGDTHTYRPPRELQARLNGPLRILDLGGNVGMFGVFAL
jgi:hypothetical protein